MVCGAPALPRNGVCPFCRSDLEVRGSEVQLLPYLARRLPWARRSRAGVLRRGAVRGIALTSAGTGFELRWRGEGKLLFDPPIGAAEWVEALLASLSQDAAENAEIRHAFLGAGWALRS